MDIEIRIGRDVEGENALEVPAECGLVGNFHATMYWKDGILTIEDNESKNGTFVNGRRIAKTSVDENDVVWLGGKSGLGCYQLNVKKIFASCREEEEKARTDYSAEFANVKQAYIDYKAEEIELRNKVSKKSQLPRLLASLIPAVIGLVILLVSKDMTLRILSMSVGSVLSGVVGILTMGKSNAENEKLNEQITTLQIKYQKKYSCPKCGYEFPFSMHWMKIMAAGKCPNPKCNAQFMKQKENK